MASSNVHDEEKARLAGQLKIGLQNIVDLMKTRFDNLSIREKIQPVKEMSGTFMARLDRARENGARGYAEFQRQVNKILPQIDAWAQEQDADDLIEWVHQCSIMISGFSAWDIAVKAFSSMNVQYLLNIDGAPYASVEERLLKLPGGKD